MPQAGVTDQLAKLQTVSIVYNFWFLDKFISYSGNSTRGLSKKLKNEKLNDLLSDLQQLFVSGLEHQLFVNQKAFSSEIGAELRYVFDGQRNYYSTNVSHSTSTVECA